MLRIETDIPPSPSLFENHMLPSVLKWIPCALCKSIQLSLSHAIKPPDLPRIWWSSRRPGSAPRSRGRRSGQTPALENKLVYINIIFKTCFSLHLCTLATFKTCKFFIKKILLGNCGTTKFMQSVILKTKSFAKNLNYSRINI